jgi:hypothetical protein
LNIATLLAKLPDSLKNEPEVEFLTHMACQTKMDIAELIYRPPATQGPSKDYDFLRAILDLPSATSESLPFGLSNRAADRNAEIIDKGLQPLPRSFAPFCKSDFAAR